MLTTRQTQTQTLVLPKPNANVIWRAAWTTLFTSLYALSHPNTAQFAIAPLLILATSLNYWRDPIRESWRRKIDIFVAYSSVSSQCAYVYFYLDDKMIHNYHKYAFLSLMFTSYLCYKLSEYLMRRQWVWASTYAHACIHIIANVANVILCTGTH
jgi:hypothetical protein